jgi:hypothetical protein
MNDIKELYTNLSVLNNKLNYIGIPRTATQSLSKYLIEVDRHHQKMCSGKKITIVVIRNPLDRLASALKHNKDWKTLTFENVLLECKTDEHYLPFTEFKFFSQLDNNAIFVKYDRDLIKKIKTLIELNYNIDVGDIEIPRINETQNGIFGCPYKLFVNQYRKDFKKIYKKDIDFYKKIFGDRVA